MLLRCYILLFLVHLTVAKGQCQDFLQTGAAFFDAVKTNDYAKAESLITILANVPEGALKSQLNTEDKAKTFWLNIYNTYVQYFLKKDPALFQERSEFFKNESITIAGKKLSLDAIEHGIIRHSRNKYSLGYIGKFFVDDFEEKFRLEKIDYRIHFALNCGAKSCPPVAKYTAAKLESQLNKSTHLYLKSLARYNPGENVVWAPALCSWFKADFGGGDGIIDMMKKYKIVPATIDPDIEYLPYDWTLKLSNYITL